MPTFVAASRCECQAALIATLDENRHVRDGKARLHGATERAPAHIMNAPNDNERFDVGWLCPFCNRNTLRAFDAGSLVALQQ